MSKVNETPADAVNQPPPHTIESEMYEKRVTTFAPSALLSGEWDGDVVYVPADETTLAALLMRYRTFVESGQEVRAWLRWSHPGSDFHPSTGRATFRWEYCTEDLPDMVFYPSTVTAESLLRAHIIPAQFEYGWDKIDVEDWVFQARWSASHYEVQSRHLAASGAVVLELLERTASGAPRATLQVTVTSLRAWLMQEVPNLLDCPLPSL